jgi:iron complex outermembrane receptor protein
MSIGRLASLTACGMGLLLAQRVGTPTDDLTNLSMEDLFSIEVTSVGRKAQEFSKAPAAAFVLTADDIRRTGATSIPEALRWVPGLTVLRLDGRSWIVSARGSARLYSDKILVMIDGRSLYTPLFSGVIWDSIDMSMEDIEQIEVVRGPGAVMWGPNALNGVINIITKRAKNTKGARVSVAAGNDLRTLETRWGDAPNERFAYRIWGKTEQRTPAFASPGYYFFSPDFIYRDPLIGDLDAWDARLGFRADWQPGDQDQLMLQGDIFRTGRQDPVGYPVVSPNIVDRAQSHSDYEGGFVQARWTRTKSSGNESVLQFSYDRNDISYPFVGGDLHNLTVDYQKRLQTGEFNELYWGAGYQQYWDSTYTNRFVAFAPRDFAYRVGDIVVRDEYQIVPGRWLLSAGARIDYNSCRKVEYQPSVRLLYTPNRQQSAWFAVSRSVRVPSRMDRDIHADAGAQMYAGFPVKVGYWGSKDMLSEVEKTAEAGYRMQSGQKWSVDAAVFWSYYSRLRVLQIPAYPTITFNGFVPSISMDMQLTNGAAGRSYGGEIWGTCQPRRGWRLSPSYSYLEESRWLPSRSGATFAWDGTPANLRHQGLLRSQHDVTRTVQLDLMLRGRSGERNTGLAAGVFFDARLGWRPNRFSELSAAAQNLGNRQVLDYYPEAAYAAIPLRRTFIVKWTQRF